ncbi:hypothetical protein EVAR_80253_1 [Eumeta japonica]|uniref:PiggyBac transposable element-derived protein domain-containing protein n=1 Tax=Eumeta variegata TaxID=151549 RepID=A0A4C1UCG9_EUMVA|nr:hypothetical protein EVAR_80253_1 [Eumeta japonica]
MRTLPQYCRPLQGEYWNAEQRDECRRNSLKQYMPKKPVKRGYKMWMKCAESGYCLDFELYTGKEGAEVETDLGGRVVDLLEDQILACGTVNSNRKLLSKRKDDRVVNN